MVMDEVVQKVEKALKIIAPEFVQFSDYEECNGKPMVCVTVVSKDFEHLRIFTRCKVVEDTLAQKEPELSKQFLFAYECYTPKEYRLIKFTRHELH